MPNKSRRNRRVTQEAKPNGTPTTLNAGSQISTFRPPAAKMAVATETGAQFVSELKWIGLTTLIIVILLVVSFFLFN
jgi:hypothetical protein